MVVKLDTHLLNKLSDLGNANNIMVMVLSLSLVSSYFFLRNKFSIEVVGGGVSGCR